MKISSEKIKADVASYWRYQAQCPLVALEVSCRLEGFNYGGQADILVVNKRGYLTETEVKLTIGDLRRDKNKRKHRSFRGNDRLYPTNHFYFAVPKEIANKTTLICDELYPYAGVLGVNGEDYYGVQEYRRPTMLRFEKLAPLQIVRMVRGQSATVCRLAEEVARLKGKYSGGRAS